MFAQKTLESLLSEAIQDNVGSLLQVQPHSNVCPSFCPSSIYEEAWLAL
jgi:hypothetical protein